MIGVGIPKIFLDLLSTGMKLLGLFAARFLLGRSARFPSLNIRQIRFLDEIDAGDFCCLQSFLMNQLKDPLTANAQNLGGLGG